MGIYYYAVDPSHKEYFSAPDDWAIKSPGCFHPENPFPGMVVMMNTRGYNFEIWDDCSLNVPPEDDYTEVTHRVFKEYRETFREHYEELEKPTKKGKPMEEQEVKQEYTFSERDIHGIVALCLSRFIIASMSQNADLLNPEALVKEIKAIAKK